MKTWTTHLLMSGVLCCTSPTAIAAVPEAPVQADTPSTMMIAEEASPSQEACATRCIRSIYVDPIATIMDLDRELAAAGDGEVPNAHVLWILKGRAYLLCGNLDSACVYILRGLDRARRLGDRHSVARATLAKGYWNLGINRIDSAEASFHEAGLLAFNLQDTQLTHDGILGMSAVLHRKGRYPEAISINRQCYDHYVSTRDTVGITNCLNLTGIYLNGIGLYAEADMQYKEALALQGVDTTYMHATILANRGSNFKDWMRPESALYCMRESLVQFERLLLRNSMIRVIHNIADIHHYQRNYAKAIIGFGSVEPELRRAGSAMDLAICEYNIASCVIGLVSERYADKTGPRLGTDTVQVGERWYSLDQCDTVLNDILILLAEQPYREFSMEVFKALHRLNTLKGDQIAANGAFVLAAHMAVKPDEQVDAVQVINAWNEWRKRQEAFHEEKEKYATLLRMGLIVFPLLLLLVVLAGYSPGIWFVRVVFFLTLLILSEWLKLLGEPMILKFVDGNIRLQFLIYIAVGMVFLLAHIWGSQRFHAYLEKRHERKKAAKEQPGNEQPENEQPEKGQSEIDPTLRKVPFDPRLEDQQKRA